MRRSAFYMGRAFSTQHLNAVRSPLMSGFISSAHSSMTRAGIASSVLGLTTSGNFLTGSALTSISSSAVTSHELALQLQVLAAHIQQAWIELCGLHSVVTFILARASIMCLNKTLHW
ncbi:Hypothetical protein, putative [Bodo saltans]|uniref:Uncharacterized protein n=1 Tax=Bodo saltans TaxID=75058 RepID=A0A0S4JWJ9_BODSA|nr:Hypothetical protein, putative [Bodo saltans]|eukprot:CUG92946.1 Hypothetical protein, putative [Bodo saltans]